MAARGVMGVRIDGVDKVASSLWEGNPRGMGADVVRDVRKVLQRDGLTGLRAQARALRVVDDRTRPEFADRLLLKPYAHPSVRVDHADWHSLTYKLQGELALTLDVGVMVDASDALTDPLHCEWAYIVNLDERLLEVYRGRQQFAHDQGRYANAPSLEGYYPIKMIAAYPLNAIPLAWADDAEAGLSADPDSLARALRLLNEVACP